MDNRWEALRKIVGPINVPPLPAGKNCPWLPRSPTTSTSGWTRPCRATTPSSQRPRRRRRPKKGIEIQKSGHYPTVAASAGYNWTRSGAEFNTDLDGAYVGLQVVVPIYEGGAWCPGPARRANQLRAAQDQLDQQRRTVTQSVKDAFRGIISSISDVQAARRRSWSARSNLESTQAGLEVGTPYPGGCPECTACPVSGGVRLSELAVRLHHQWSQAAPGHSTLNRDVLAKGNAWLTAQDPVAPPAN